MSDKIRCPACAMLLRIPVGAVAGSLIQCPHCAAKLALPAAAAPPRPFKAIPLDEAPDDQDEDELRPRRKPKSRPRRPRPKSTGPSVGVILSTVLGLLFLAGSSALGLYLYSQRQPAPPNAGLSPFAQNPNRPPPNAGRRNEQQQDPGAPTDDAPPAAEQLFTLSNGRCSSSIHGLNFEAELAGGNNARMGGIAYFWVIRSSRGNRYECRYNALDLQRSRTLSARSIGGFGEIGGSTYECWIEERPFVAMRGEEGKRVSNAIPLQVVNDRPGGPPFGPRF